MSRPLEAYLVCADVLRDAAGLFRHHVRLADGVEKRRLAVVHVPHDRDDRRSRHPDFGRIGLFLEDILGALDAATSALTPYSSARSMAASVSTV